MPWDYLVSDEPPQPTANRYMVPTRPGHQITALGHWCDRVAAPLPDSPYPRLPAAPHRPFHTTASFHPDNHPARYVPTEHNGWGKRANPIYFNGMEDYVPESLHLQNPKGWAVDAQGEELFEAIPSAKKEGEWERGRKLTNMDLWACPGMKFFGTPYLTRRLGPSPALAKAKKGNVFVVMKFGPELPPGMLLDIREQLKVALRKKKWPREEDRVEVERLVDDPKTPEAVLAPLLALGEDNEVDVLERIDESIENAQQKDEPVAVNSFNRSLRREAKPQDTPSFFLDTPASKDQYFEAKEPSTGNHTAHDHSGYDTSSYLDPHDDTFAHKYTPAPKSLKSSQESVTSPSVLSSPESNKSSHINTTAVASVEDSLHDTTVGDESHNATSIDGSACEVSPPPSPSILMPPPPSINPLEVHKKFMAGWVECKPIKPTKLAPLGSFFEDDHLENTFLHRRSHATPTHKGVWSPEDESCTGYTHVYELKKSAHAGGLFAAFKKHVEAPYVDHSLFAKWKKFNRDPLAMVPGADVTTDSAAWERGVVHDVEEEDSMGEPLIGFTPAPEKEFGKPVMESTPGPSNTPRSRAEFTPWLRGIEGVGSARPERKTPCRQNSGNVKQVDQSTNWQHGLISESPEFTDEPSSMLESFSTPVLDESFKTPRPPLVRSLTAPPLGAEFRTPLKNNDKDSISFNFSSWIRDEEEVDYAPRIDLNRTVSPVPTTRYFKLGKTHSPAKPSPSVLTRICTPFRHRETSKTVYPSPHSISSHDSAIPAYSTFPLTAATRNPQPANVAKPFIIFPALAAFKVPLKPHRTYLLTEIPALNRQAAYQHTLAEAARMLRIKDWLNFIGTRRPLFWYSALWLDPPGHPRYPKRVMVKTTMEPPTLNKKGKKQLKRKATASSVAKGKKLITPDAHAKGKFKLEAETLNEKKGKGKRQSTSREVSPPKKTITPNVRAKGKFSPPIISLDVLPSANGKRKSTTTTTTPAAANLTPLAQHSQTKLNSTKSTTRTTHRLDTGSENAPPTTTAKKPRRVTTRTRSPPPRYRTTPHVSAYMRHIRSFPNPSPLTSILKSTLPSWFDGSDLQYHLHLEARVAAQPTDIQAEVEADGRAIGLLSRTQGVNGEPSAWANAMEERWNEVDFGREEMLRVREERVERERVAGERRGRVRTEGVLQQRFRQGRDFAVFMDPEA